MHSLRDKYTAAIEENNSLSVRQETSFAIDQLLYFLHGYSQMRVQALERERLEGDEQVSKLKETVASQNREVADLLAQVCCKPEKLPTT